MVGSSWASTIATICGVAGVAVEVKPYAFARAAGASPPAGPVKAEPVAPAATRNGRAPGVPFFTTTLRSAKHVAWPALGVLVHSRFPTASWVVVTLDGAVA